jgi:hypothetical protein
VLDDQLRPALQTILTASGSLTQSQKALNVALDVSAATGKTVLEVSQAIAKGYSGQTTALTRLGAGLDKTVLASGDMNLILDELGNKFSGQATARLDTYAGKMDLLQGSSARASETIGKGLLDSLSMLGKDQNIGNLGTAMEKVAETIANVVVGLAAIIGKVIQIGSAIFNKLQLDKVIGFLYKFTGISLLANLGKSETNKSKSNFTYEIWDMAGIEARATELKNLQARNKLNAKLLAADKAKLALDELAKKFDTERIGLTTALNFATDDETKLRIKAQLALLDQNEVLAKKYNAELDAARAAKEFADAARDAATSMKNVFENAPNYGAFRESPFLPENLSMSGSVPSYASTPTTQNNYFEIKPQGSIIAQDDFVDQVQRAMQKIETNGYITAPAGFL